jgi:hypothetical protein
MEESTISPTGLQGRELAGQYNDRMAVIEYSDRCAAYSRIPQIE